jgi:hypothetical protein
MTLYLVGWYSDNTIESIKERKETMNQTVSVQGDVTEKVAGEQLKQQLARYLEQQPDSMKAFHKWMKGLEAASLALIAAALILALYISIAWKNFEPKLIPTAWFLFAASVAPLLLLSGIHTLILRAFPTSLMSGKAQKLVTGRGAIWAGCGFIVGGLVGVAFWGLFAYSAWTLNWALLIPMITVLGVAMGVMIIIGMLLTTIQKLTKTR